MTDVRFNDFISGFERELSEQYVSRRPSYPAELFQWLTDISPAQTAVWDAGTGGGELAVPLAAHFDHVIASDSSEAFLDASRQAPNIDYRLWPSEEPDLEDQSVDLITAGMAVHWFKADQFYDECRRIIRPGGVMAALGFYFFDIEGGIGDLVREWYMTEMQQYEFPELVILRDAYADLEFPFPAIETPQFTMRAVWSRQQLEAFIDAWIVVQRARKVGVEPTTELFRRIRREWADERREISWPLFIHAGVVS